MRLTNNQTTQTFACNPYWIDAVMHLAGFILNGDVTKSDDVAYIFTAFRQLFILEPLKPGTEHFSFSSTQAEDKKGISLGHVYLFQGQRLVAVCAGLSFQKMTKDVLRKRVGKSEMVAKPDANEHSADDKASVSPVGSSVGLASTPTRRPAHTSLIWAKKGFKEREGVGNEDESEMTEEDSPYFGNIMEDPATGLRSWFYAKRTNLGANGWDKLVGDVEIDTIDGDHFSIVTPPLVSDLCYHYLSVDMLTMSRSKC